MLIFSSLKMGRSSYVLVHKAAELIIICEILELVRSCIPDILTARMTYYLEPPMY